MKKILAALTAVLASAALSVSAFAAEIDANEQAILDYLASAKINGASISESLINQTTAYFMRDGVSVTADQSDAFIADAEALVALCETNGVTAGTDGVIDVEDLNTLSGDNKAKVLDSASALASTLDLTFDSNPVLKTGKFYDANGEVVGTVDAAVKATGFGGFEGIAIASGAMLALTAVSAVIAKKRNLSK